MAGEFDLIRCYFSRPTRHTALAGGDDCALVQVGAGQQLAVSTDMLVEGTHFFPDVDPYLLGWKTLAVNLSDLAAMGATPKWASLALSLPTQRAQDEAWMSALAKGFYALADQYQVDLIGGDTTRGPLNLCVTIMGELPTQTAMRRAAAQAGDEIWVSGTPGLASLGLLIAQHDARIANLALPEQLQQAALRALQQPQPRVELGLCLREWAHACIDVSDGLLADLAHIAVASQCSAVVHAAALPLQHLAEVPVALAQHCVLSGGDDYELCFTAPAQHHLHIKAAAQQLRVKVHCIGKMQRDECLTGDAQAEQNQGSRASVIVRDAQGRDITPAQCGYDHFQNT